MRPRREDEKLILRLRWYMLTLFVLFGVSNQLQYFAVATIVRQVEDRFDCSAWEVNLLTAMFPIGYVVGAFPALAVTEWLGLRASVVASAALTAAGAVLKFVGAVWFPKYAMLVAAQGCNAVGQLVVLAFPALIASTWFPVEERGIATAAGALSPHSRYGNGAALLPSDCHGGSSRRQCLRRPVWLASCVGYDCILASVAVLQGAPRPRPSG